MSLTKKQILEFREHLERSQNPVFFYDNDADGFCSYVLLRRFLNRGKGVAVKSHPDVGPMYAKKAQELNADCVFVLDRPILGKEFVEEIKNLGIPIIWLDHHEAENEDYDYENLFVYNPQKGNKKVSGPTTYWSYKIADKKEDIWIALMGCVADHYLPEFAEEFGEKYGEYWSKGIKEPFDVYYGTGIGRLARSISFGIKDSVTHVVQLQNMLINAKGPSDLDLELEGNKSFGKKYREIMNKYSKLVEKAKRNVGEKLLDFNYSGDLSISSDLSNELSYYYSDKVIMVSYSAGPMTTLSMRGGNVRKILNEVLPMFDDARGGGHEKAIGAKIQTKDLERFRDEISKRVK
tara:strand:- start:1164 stop:2210 length:1047 start_codon:yes stop_codon:yes gene_type:complete